MSHLPNHLPHGYRLMNTTLQRDSRSSERFVIATVAILSTIIFLNLNGVASLIFGTEGLLSPVMAILVGCALLSGINTAVFVTRRIGFWYLAFVGSYLMIGLLSAAYFGFREALGTAIWGAFLNLLTVATFFTAAFILGRQDRLFEAVTVLKGFMTVMAVSIIASPLYAEFLPAFHDYDVSRNAGVLGNPNVAASLCYIGFAVTLAQIRTYNYFSVAQVLLFFAATASTFSKAGFIAILALAVIFALKSWASGRRNLPVLLTISIVTLVTVALGVALVLELESYFELSPEQLRRLDAIRLIFTSGVLDDETTTNRTGLLQLAFAQWLASPIIGLGLGAMHLVAGSEWGVHNTFMMVLGESGVVPFFLLAGLCIAGIRWGWRNFESWEGRFVLGYGISFSLSCLSSHNILEDRFHNAMIGISLAIVLLARLRSGEISRGSQFG